MLGWMVLIRNLMQIFPTAPLNLEMLLYLKSTQYPVASTQFRDRANLLNPRKCWAARRWIASLLGTRYWKLRFKEES